MKKLHSKKIGGEAFALDAAQLDLFKQNGYTVPSPEEVIADAAVHIEPPEGKRAYVVFDFKTGVFSVRARTATLDAKQVGGFVGEVVQAALLCRFLEQADPDRPKADNSAADKLSTLAAMIKNALIATAEKSAADKPAPPASGENGAKAEDTPEVVE